MNTEDKIIQEIIELKERVGEMATNEHVDKLERKIMDQFDKQLVILQRLDQERIFTAEWIRRIEKDVETVKLRLQVA